MLAGLHSEILSQRGRGKEQEGREGEGRGSGEKVATDLRSPQKGDSTLIPKSPYDNVVSTLKFQERGRNGFQAR